MKPATPIQAPMTTRRESPPSEGIIFAIDGLHLEIHCAEQTLRARRAVSCLVQPEVGDTVLLHRSAEQTWVLAILDRLEPQSITIGGNSEFRLQAEALHLEGKRATMTFDETSVRSRRASLQVDEVSLVSRLLRSVCERVTSRAKRSTRLVTESDTVHCGSHNLQADEQIRVHGKHVLTSAKRLVRFDGEQIHMG